MPLNINGIIRKALAFVRWVCSPEELPAPPRRPGDAYSVRPRFWQWLLASEQFGGVLPKDTQRRLWSFSLLPETLPDLANQRSNATGRSQTFWNSVMSTDELPQPQFNKGRSARTSGFVCWMLKSESCPSGEVPVSPKDSGAFLRVFAPEECPRCAATHHDRRKGFVQWLLSPDEL